MGQKNQMTKKNNTQLKEYIKSVVLSGAELKITIEDDNGLQVGHLRPIIRKDIYDDVLLQTLTKWRKDNMDMFLTNFTATPERTRKYLEKITSDSSAQTLFMVEERGKLVGQVGWKDLTELDAIMDNGMKGERTDTPKLLIYAHKALAKWLFLNTEIKFIYGWLFADNIPGIMMNKQIGWSEWIRHPLIKSSAEEEWA